MKLSERTGLFDTACLLLTTYVEIGESILR